MERHNHLLAQALNDLSFGPDPSHGGPIARAGSDRGCCRRPSVPCPAVVAVWATPLELTTLRTVPMRPAAGSGRTHAGALDRVAGPLPVSESAFGAADVAVPMRGECGD